MGRRPGSKNKTKYRSEGVSRMATEAKEPTKTTTTLKEVNDNQDKSPQNTVMTPDQQAIVRRVEAESAEWAPITEESMHDFSLSKHPLSLQDNFPEAWKEQSEKRYAFRWCERTEKRIDELTRSGHPITQWKLCTRTTTPFLTKYIDPIWGCVTRLDQVLLFRPWDRHMIEMRAKNRNADTKAESGKMGNVATRNAPEGVEAHEGPEFKIGSSDEVQYEDSRAEFEDIGDLVVES